MTKDVKHHTVKEIHFSTFIDNIKTNDVDTLDCLLCRAMGNDCDKIDSCPTPSDLAEFLTGESVIKNPIKLAKVEYDILQALSHEYEDICFNLCPIACDLQLQGYFKQVYDDRLTIGQILSRAEVED